MIKLPRKQHAFLRVASQCQRSSFSIKMKRKVSYLSLFFLLAILASYLYPTPDAPPGELYARVEPGLAASLRAFRSEHPPPTPNINRPGGGGGGPGGGG